MPNRHRISIDLDFNGPQANLYGVPPAQAAAFEAGDLVGDTRRGGSCNFEHVQLIPHCNGTHTECIGHITDARVYISDVLTDSRFPGQLVTVAPEALDDAPGETYNACATPQDRVITREQLAAAIDTHRPTDALVVRTLPNPPRKPRTTYTGEPPMPPYFTHEAMELITRLNVQHLIVDFPSVDRLEDAGRLDNHRIYWGTPREGHLEGAARHRDSTTRGRCTITELVYIPDDLADGPYTVELQIPGFRSDAAPSRVFLLTGV